MNRSPRPFHDWGRVSRLGKEVLVRSGDFLGELEL